MPIASRVYNHTLYNSPNSPSFLDRRIWSQDRLIGQGSILLLIQTLHILQSWKEDAARNELLLGHSGVHHTHDPFRIDGQISITMLKRTMLLASLLIFLAIVMSLHGACEFTCPRDHRKIPSGRKSEVNGCGVQGMSIYECRSRLDSRIYGDATNTIAVTEDVERLRSNAIGNFHER